jgi:hypothetical protein
MPDKLRFLIHFFMHTCLHHRPLVSKETHVFDRRKDAKYHATIRRPSLANRKENHKAENNKRFFHNQNPQNKCLSCSQIFGSHCVKVIGSAKLALNAVGSNVGADVTAHPMHNASKLLRRTWLPANTSRHI